jgi:hypothetical protein
LGESAWPALRWLTQNSDVERIEATALLLERWLDRSRQLTQLDGVLRLIASDWSKLSAAGQSAVLLALDQCFVSAAAGDGANPSGDAPRLPQSGERNESEDYGAVAAAIRTFLLQVQPLSQYWGRRSALRLSRWACPNSEDSAGKSLVVSATVGPNGSEVSGDWWQWCRELASLALTDDREEVRLEAVRLAALPQLDMRAKLAKRLLDLPGEPSATVRVLLLLAVGDGTDPDLAPTEELARWLHDPSVEVQATCEQVLRARGLSPRQLQLARMWTHPDPMVRAQVPGLVYQEKEVDPVAWLDRLSRDASPVVRAAAIRAAAEHMEVRFVQRLAELAEDDTSPTVRQLAIFYQRAMLLRH